MSKKVGIIDATIPAKTVIQFLTSNLKFSLLKRVVKNTTDATNRIANVHQRGEKIPPIAKIRNAPIFPICFLFSLKITPITKSGK